MLLFRRAQPTSGLTSAIVGVLSGQPEAIGPEGEDLAYFRLADDTSKT